MRRKENKAILGAGLLQGICLVAFPAVSTILTNPHSFGFSNSTYGSLFIPEALLSILASAFTPKLARHLGQKKVYLLGLITNFLAMAFLCLSALFVREPKVAYPILLIATSFIGIGFGLLVPTLNALAALMYPTRINLELLLLNALLGLGTTLSPLLVTALSINLWWGLPAVTGFLLLFLFFYSLPLNLPGGKLDLNEPKKRNFTIPKLFWMFALFALIYGIIETLNANWMAIYMNDHVLASKNMQSLALTTFWAMVTLGRVLFSLNFLNNRLVFQWIPFLASFSLFMISAIHPGSQMLALMYFGLSGLGCSALLPLLISFGSTALKEIAQSIPGMLIAFYLLGYGIAAFGVGPLEDYSHINLRTIYLGGAYLALLLGLLASLIIKKNKEA